MNNKIILYVGKKTYDITEFIYKHPGGHRCLIKKNNTDVTKDYNFHSKNAKKIWEKYLVRDYKEKSIYIKIYDWFNSL